MSVRNAAMAGKFYPAGPQAIGNLLENLIRSEGESLVHPINFKKVLGGIVPHAGYIYSGYESIHFFDFIRRSNKRYDTFIIINPNHRGMGDEITIDDHDAWETPLGEVLLDRQMKDLVNWPKSNMAQKDEHGAEVIIPYLQYFLSYNFQILPVCMLKQTYKNAKKLAESIFNASQQLDRNILVIASSDFSHYVQPEVGFYNDNLVINRIMNFNIHGLYDTVVENNISVCGYGPIMTLMFYARMASNDPKVEVLARGNSGKNSSSDLVVDYVSALFYE